MIFVFGTSFPENTLPITCFTVVGFLLAILITSDNPENVSASAKNNLNLFEVFMDTNTYLFPLGYEWGFVRLIFFHILAFF